MLYGLDKELAEKAAAKYDVGMEHKCREWIEAVTGDKLGESTLQEELKNGVVLCNLINAIKPGLINKPKNSKMPFMQVRVRARARVRISVGVGVGVGVRAGVRVS